MENSTSVEVEEDEIICQCFQVTESKIRSLIVKNDVTEIDDITLACEAGGNCASCHILIQLFIDQGANVNAVGSDGRSPIHIAIAHGNIDIVNLLKKHGAIL